MLTGVGAAVSYWIAYRFAIHPGMLLGLSLAITVIVTVLLIYLRTREREFQYISLVRRDHKDDWLGTGTFDYNRSHRAYLITNSDTGFIYAKTLTWSDYRLNFRFKILSGCVGAVVRAVNLGNLVMLQIGTMGIRPHLRVNGGWYVEEAAQAKLEFSEPLSSDAWYQATVVCDKAQLRIMIRRDRTLLFDRIWTIPPGPLQFILDRDAQGQPKTFLPFSVNLEYGTVGFRNWGPEQAVVREVLIERLRG